MTASRYEALVPIGTGGMATVFIGRARGAEGFSRLVALKRAHPHIRLDPGLAESMRSEARLASRLHHANVVSVLDVEEDEGDLVLVLDYVEGCTLRTLLSKVDKLGEWRPRETLRIVLDIAAGLHAAHQTTDDDGRLLGVVHRDVSPSNVLVGVDGVARLADFGIAKAVLAGGGERTETGVLKGKSSYMAPEYVMHQQANAASDLFSLAVVTWEALAGTRLFKGATEIETLKRVATAASRPLGEVRPELGVLDGVLLRALSRLPSDRQPSVEHFAADLEAAARAHGLVAAHSEVSALVERAAATELAERRRVLRDDAETVVFSKSAALEAIEGGDDLPTMAHTGEIIVGGRDDVATESVSDNPEVVLARAAEPPIELPPPSVVPSPWVDRAVPLDPRVGHVTKPVRRRRSRELLALLGAFALLALALGAMAFQLQNSAAPPATTAHAASIATVAAPPPIPPPIEPPAAVSAAPVPVAETVPAPAASAVPSTVAAPPPAPPSGTPSSRRHKPFPVPAPTPTIMPKKAPPNPYPDGASKH